MNASSMVKQLVMKIRMDNLIDRQPIDQVSIKPKTSETAGGTHGKLAPSGSESI